jgi:hypothetical protein
MREASGSCVCRTPVRQGASAWPDLSGSGHAGPHSTPALDGCSVQEHGKEKCDLPSDRPPDRQVFVKAEVIEAGVAADCRMARLATGGCAAGVVRIGDSDQLLEVFSRRGLARLCSVVLLHEFFGAGGTIRGELRRLSRSGNR